MFAVSSEPNGVCPLGVKTPRVKSAEKVRRTCGESAEKVFKAIIGNSRIKTHEISAKTHLAQRTVEKAISVLKKEGVLQRIGPDKGGHWEVVRPPTDGGERP
jgi:ATP-dependent DNA helicase RecG